MKSSALSPVITIADIAVGTNAGQIKTCLLYTSDAADE